MPYKPSSDEDRRRKLDDAQADLMDAQLMANEVTRRQAAGHNDIRTKYVDKRHKQRLRLQNDRYWTDEEINALIKQCVPCPTCGHWFLPESLVKHQASWGNTCIAFRGKLLKTEK